MATAEQAPAAEPELVVLGSEPGPQGAPRSTARRAWSPRTLGWYLLLTVLSVVVLAPIYLTIIRALSTPLAALESNPLLPAEPQWDIFGRAFTEGNLGAAMVRSLIVTVAITTGQLVTSVLAAYAFAFLRFPAKGLLFALFMATLLLPMEVTLLPNLQTVRELGWFNSYQGLAVPFLATALGTFLIRQGFLGIPVEIREAARLEGYGHLTFLWKFAMPLTRPVIASFTVIAFLGAFNQYLWPRAVTTDTDGWATIQIALGDLATSLQESKIVLAGAIVASVPVVVLLIFFQRQIVRGLTAGAVKG
ncbi:carbohydrate ABC transporter permease [soil metagenome]